MQTLTKAERLSSKIIIDKLFSTGKAFNHAPFKVVWLQTTEDSVPAQILISVPKRLFKRAVDRNRLKRLIREGYRKNKHLLYDQLNGKKILFMFIFTSKTKKTQSQLTIWIPTGSFSDISDCMPFTVF